MKCRFGCHAAISIERQEYQYQAEASRVVTTAYSKKLSLNDRT